MSSSVAKSSNPMGLTAVVWLMSAASLFAGVAQSLTLKYQNRSLVTLCDTNGVCKDTHFKQAFLQTSFMFLGECLAIPIFLFRPHAMTVWWKLKSKWTSKIHSSPQCIDDAETDDETSEGSAYSHPLSVWWWLTPAPLDFLECALGNLALTITYSSTVQMLHNFMVIASAGFTILIFRKRLSNHEWLGCVIITSALILSGVPALSKPEKHTDFDEAYHWVGILLAVISTCVHALQNIWEEALFNRTPRVTPLIAVGIEGGCGLCVSLAALPIVSMIGYERPMEGLKEIIRRGDLMTMSIVYATASFINNLAGLQVTKWSNALIRCVFMSIRPPIVWIAEIIFGWNGYDWFNFIAMFVLIGGLWVHLNLPPLNRYFGNEGTQLPHTLTHTHTHKPNPQQKHTPATTDDDNSIELVQNQTIFN